MDRAEAAALLGVRDGASSRQVRAAYRQAIREHHPDRAGPSATDDAARIIEAYRVLSDPVPVAAAPAQPAAAPAQPAAAQAQPAAAQARPVARPAPESSGLVTLVDDDTVAFAFPADEVFVLLAEAADDIGDITYIDPDAGLLEVLVTLPFGGPWSVVISLQGRADQVEAFCTVEALDGSEAVPGPVINLLLSSLRQRLRGR